MSYILDWNDYPNFTIDELKCKHTGECNMHPEMMRILQEIRDDIKRPLFVSSGFRSVKHPVEVSKEKPGEHTLGMAVDLIAYGTNALEIISRAQAKGICRIGVHQKGNANSRFVHLGIADKYALEFPKSIWTY